MNEFERFSDAKLKRSEIENVERALSFLEENEDKFYMAFIEGSRHEEPTIININGESRLNPISELFDTDEFYKGIIRKTKLKIEILKKEFKNIMNGHE